MILELFFAFIPYRLAVVQCPDKTSDKMIARAMNKVRSFYQNKLNITLIESAPPMPLGEFPTNLDNTITAFDSYETAVPKIPKTFSIIVAAPIRAYGRKLMGGLTRPFSFSWGGPICVFAGKGVKRKYLAVVILHELGHVMGLPHKSRCSWMDIKALACRKIDWSVDSSQYWTIQNTLVK